MPTRQYRDPSGTEWEVFEVHRLSDRPASVRPALSSGWLAFVSRGERRRLPAYPSDWMELSDDELHELLAVALVTTEPTRSTDRPSGGFPRVEPPPGDRLVDRRTRPRPSRSDDQQSVTTGSAVRSEARPEVAGGLPVAPPGTVTGSLGSAELEALVRTHAREARDNGVAIIQGMIGVKHALAGQGADVSPGAIKRLRSVFVEEFYFSS